MVRVNQFIALGAVLALSMLTAQTALAGPAGATGDSITVVGSVGGGPGNLWVTDPDLASANLGEYSYQLFGPVDANYRFCASWEGGAQVPVAVKANDANGYYDWYSQDEVGDVLHWTFGNPATDTPTVMDYDGDGEDDVVVVRDAGPALLWIVDDGAGGNEQFNFGPAGSEPVPGNWDGDTSAADNPAVTVAVDEDRKRWMWGVAGEPDQEGVYIHGKPADVNVAYTDNGVTRPGVSQNEIAGNLFVLQRESDEVRVFLGSAANTAAVGNCSL